MMLGGGLFLLILVLILADDPGGRRSGRLWPILLLAVFALPLMGMFWMMGFGAWNWMHGAGSWSWWGLLSSTLILGGLAVGGYLRARRSEPESEEEQILRLRLAKGEVTAEEYDLLRAKLKATGS